MKIAIIGAGNVGSALGTGWVKRGHEVTFGVRDPKKSDSASAAKMAGVMEAAQASDVIVLSVPWGAVGDALKSTGDLRERSFWMRPIRCCPISPGSILRKALPAAKKLRV